MMVTTRSREWILPLLAAVLLPSGFAAADWDYCPNGWTQTLFCQADGTGIPRLSNPPDLPDFFGWCGENAAGGIDYIWDASLVPETFFPAAQLTFRLVGEEAGYENIFGWYNVGDDVTQEANRHIVLYSNYNHGYPHNTWYNPSDCDGHNAEVTNGTCTGNYCSVVTATFCNTASTPPRNPQWKGGPIGFFIVTPQGCNSFNPSCNNNARNNYPGYQYMYFSEPRLNILEQNQQKPYIHHLVYQSKIDPKWFYFGFEDLFRGGDNDFEDTLVRVEGLLVDAPQEVCNNIDDDCDGLTDENVYEPCSTACGNGVRVCTAGAFGPCSAPDPQPEQCNGIDDDCNGLVDDNLVRSCSNACGSGVEVCVNGAWYGCTAPTPSAEVCDNLDNDCDGCVDGTQGPGGCTPLARSCSTACGTGTETCVHGTWVNCTAQQPSVEVCDNVDNDCDGLTDENLVLPCATACGNGQRVCQNGVWGECSAPKPQPEICDDLDNNCDGRTDELWPDKGQPCTVYQGQCVGYGLYVCNVAHNGLACNGTVTPGIEICDGQDNDCDGAVDESDPLLGLPCGVCDPGDQPPCYSTVGECHPGQWFCVSGMLTCLGQVKPSPEVCDGKDNDCDGKTDEPEDFGPEICGDGIDNNCDGRTDEGCGECAPGTTQPCGSNVGECRQGLRICDSDGNWGACEGEIGPSPEVCDGKDNDCDGLTDEDAVPEICDNGIDDDCDGLIDSMDPDCAECTPGSSRPCGSDVGECRMGRQSCTSQGHWNQDCSGAVDPQPETCDGKDNDCDGLTDEGTTCSGYDVCLCGECASACSAGECPAGGNRHCVNGWCVSDPCCGVQCPAGQSCDAMGRCQDPCTTGQITCPPDQDCRLGICVPADCFTPGHDCTGNQLCVAGVCQPDPCAAVQCPVDQYCREGNCLAVACGACGPNQICVAGACQDSLCAGIHCEPGQLCVMGVCAADTCQGIACPDGFACQNGKCQPDPCLGIDCPAGSVCRDGYCVAVTNPEDGGSDGGADAGMDSGSEPGNDDGAGPDAGGGDGTTKPDTSGGGASGCGCASEGGSADAFLPFGALLFLLSRRRWTSELLLLAGLTGWLAGCGGAAAPSRDGNMICKGSTDCQAGYFCANGSCKPRPLCSDVDNDGYCSVQEGGDDCNDNRADIHPGAVELCDGVDNNCDGRVDEGCDCKAGDTSPCGSHTGICLPGTMACQDGRWGDCQGGKGPEPAENCDDDLDNNCNGAVNEGCPCDQGASRSCASNLGECTYGVQTCVQQNGEWHWSTCTGGTPPTSEICGDGLDNDCDGAVDNGCACGPDGTTRPCGLNIGICHAGKQSCQGGIWSACEGARWPEEEICDGLDNNCNRLVDEGCDCVDGTFQICGSDVGECRRGTQKCILGQWGPCEGEVGPAPEICDGHDNDCDGQVDEDFPDLRQPCKAGTGACERPGVMKCTDDKRGTICSATPGQPSVEICDGRDNDCDGLTDEDFPNVGGPCTVGLGECANHGVMVCSPAGGVMCNVVPFPPQQEICDGKDNNCDGFTDESFPILGVPCTAGLGECLCSGVTVCAPDGLSTMCDATPGLPSPEVCDGKDNDCDGLTDEDLSRPCANACGTGVETCYAGQWIGCTAPLPSPEICDGLDNNCDGQTDEGFDFNNSLDNCGGCMRPCYPAHGTGVCVLGTCQVASCDPGYYDLNHNAIDGCEYACSFRGPEQCNGIDDDCDGATDEDLGAPPTPCLNQGVCSNVQPLCRNGSWVCLYPPSYQVTETKCDNLDNDCDGVTDEGFPDKKTPCSAGQGICRTAGVMVCSADGTKTECTAKADLSKQTAEICDGLDNDCDGQVDNNIDLATEMIQLTAAGHTFWIDQYEASRPDATSGSRGYNDAYPCSRGGVMPWNDVTWDQAKAACQARGKRLCTDTEWQAVCKGSQDWTYPYGNTYTAGTCNDSQPAGDILPSGQMSACKSEAGVMDMSGNLSEWTDCQDARNCRIVKPMFGGKYDDTLQQLLTCWFRSNAGGQNHQYGVGFRCCKD